MIISAVSLRIRIYIAIIIFVLYILLVHGMNMNFINVTRSFNIRRSCSLRSNATRNISYENGWQLIGHTYEEQVYLRRISTVIALRSETIEKDVPTVPCLSVDHNLLVLSVAASRVRYGVGITFVMVYPNDVKTVLPKHISSNPMFSIELNLWCIFDDGSVTPAYSYDSSYGNDRASLLDCSLTSFASDQLWKYNKALRVHLASTIDKDRNVPILKAFVSVPKPLVLPLNTSHQQLTLCTSPLHNSDKYLIQWIEFHRLVGFRKFVIYNTTDTDNHLSTILNVYTQKYPNLVDVVQWNFSSLALVDVLSGRYFQTEALHDCLIRYGDQSEWLGMIDLDEYLVPNHPYETVLDYIHDNFGRRIIGSINLWSQFFCAENVDNYTLEENDTSRLTIE